MTRRRWLSAAGVVMLTAACFHQVVQTGRPPGANVIDKPWVSGWLWGIVPADPIETRPQCPTGVAIVETEMSFVNGLASFITLGIYTPQHVRITCASGGTASLPHDAIEMRVPVGATDEQRAEVLARAIEQSGERHLPVVLRY